MLKNNNIKAERKIRNNQSILHKKKLWGASMVEYLLGLVILVTALTVIPLPNTKDSSLPNSKDLTAVELFELALKKEYASYSKSLAEPR